MNTLKALLLLTAALILGGCASTPKSIGGSYALVSISNADATLDKPIIMHVREGSISGSGPVNQWQASVDEDDEIGPIIATRRAGPPQLMELESELMQALEGATIEVDQRGKLTTKKKRDVTAVFQYVEIDPTSTTNAK